MWPAFWKKHYESILEVGIGETSRFEEIRRNFSTFAKYPQSVYLEMGQERGPFTDAVAASGCSLVHFQKWGSVGPQSWAVWAVIKPRAEREITLVGAFAGKFLFSVCAGFIVLAAYFCIDWRI